MRIALLCPTRERSKDVKRLIDSLEATTSNLENVILYLGVDEDDPQLKISMQYDSNYRFVKVIKIPACETFLGLGKIWNIMAEQVDDEILSMIGDDMVFETNDWDKQILNNFEEHPDNALLVYCNDGLRGSGNHFHNVPPLAVNSFIHRVYYDTFGYYVREEWKHGFHDTWLHDVYEMTGRLLYRSDIMIRHLHVCNPTLNIAADKTTKNLEQSYSSVGNPDLIYKNLLSVRQSEVNKLKDIISTEAEPIPKLSILICTMYNREGYFNRLLTKLREQESDEIEIHYEIDNGEISIGEKRNKLLKKSRGDYVAFVDDDDMVSDDYVEKIINSINKSQPDVIGIHLLMTVDGQHEERTYHSLKYDHWYDEPDPDRPGKIRYFRNPNHINPVKRELALKVMFPTKDVGEDRDYSKDLLQYLKTEEYIEEPIYYYLYRSKKNFDEPGQIIIDKLIEEEILDLNNLPRIFIETGTYLGWSTKIFANYFDKVYTIEINEKLITSAKKYCNKDNITFIHGSSPNVLGELLPTLNERYILFLDAHHSGNDTGLDEKYGFNGTPILDELKSLENVPNGSIILIDDCDDFGVAEKYPHINELKSTIREYGFEFEILPILKGIGVAYKND